MTNIKTKVTFYNQNVSEAFEKAIQASLRAIGEHGTDQLASDTHKVTGQLSNSWNYRTTDYTSFFGTVTTDKSPKKPLTENEKVSTPSRYVVRMGSNLVYAEPYNNRFKVMENTVDKSGSVWGKLASLAFKKVIGV